MHGFRAMARTILDEVLGFRPDFIEHQLAHAVRDPNGRALQPHGVPAGTKEDDARVGRLPGPASGRVRKSRQDRPHRSLLTVRGLPTIMPVDRNFDA